MATVVTVHGTFAHNGGTAFTLAPGTAVDLQWWQPSSSFEAHARELLGAEQGTLDFVPFIWSSSNSEMSRRDAGSSLLTLLRSLEERKEPYCVVGHSHGGSVIASALMESEARRLPLEGLKKWITVGTPFVELRRERFLFSRLTLPRKIMLVASLMLLMMFAFYLAGEIMNGGQRLGNERYLAGLITSAAMMSIPFIVFYTVLKYLDRRQLFSYAPKLIRRAQERYGKKWLSLCHEDDEAVQGLRCLPSVQVHFFDREFAVSTLTMASIFFLPLLYFFVVTSPGIMIGIADFLKNRVYAVDQFTNATGPVAEATQDFGRLRSQMRQAREEAERSNLDPSQAENARQRAEAMRQKLREMRTKMQTTYPELAEFERAQRFKRRFLERDGKPCEGGSLCGGGHDFAINSQLLFHVVTDEVSSAVVNDDLVPGALGGALRLLVPIVLVPAVFAGLALAFLALMHFVAVRVSSVASRVLNSLTLAELKRSAFGNDTDGEVVLGADQRPPWLSPGYGNLPSDIGDKISEQCNRMTIQSLAKFRNAISTLAFSEGEQSKAGLISSYLTWKELIHATYFDVAEFRKLVALAISQAEGFKPSEAFKTDPDFERARIWLASVEPKAPA